MEKRKLILIAVIVLVVVLALLLLISWLRSGDDSNNGDNNSNNNNAGNKVILEYWGLWEPESVMKPIIDRYQDQNPNVTVKYSQKSFTQYEETVFTRLEQGTTSNTPAPDIMRINNSWLSKFQPYLYPIPSQIMSGSEYASTFYPTAVEDFTGTDSFIYAMPLEVDGLAVIYNKELLQQAGFTTPPADWDSMIETAKALTKTDSSGNITQAGLAMGTSKNVSHSADIFSMLLLQNGVEINQNFNTEVDLANSRAVSALEFYTDFALVHKTWSGDLPNDLEMFYQGKVAMIFAPSWRVFDILNSNPDIEFGVAAAPTLGTEQVYYSMYWGEAVSKDSKYPLEAWKFVKYLSQQEQLREMYSNSSKIRAFGEPYSRVSMGSEIATDPYAGAIIEMAPNMKAWKMGDQTFTEETLRTAINDVAENGVEAGNAMNEAEIAINDKLQSIIKQE